MGCAICFWIYINSFGQEQISKLILFMVIIMAIIYVIIILIKCYFGWYSICCEKDEIDENNTNSTDINQLFVNIDQPEDVYFSNTKKYIDDDNETLYNK